MDCRRHEREAAAARITETLLECNESESDARWNMEMREKEEWANTYAVLHTLVHDASRECIHAEEMVHRRRCEQTLLQWFVQDEATTVLTGAAKLSNADSRQFSCLVQ
jgi:hypothetical protein